MKNISKQVFHYKRILNSAKKKKKKERGKQTVQTSSHKKFKLEKKPETKLKLGISSAFCLQYFRSRGEYLSNQDFIGVGSIYICCIEKSDSPIESLL